MLNFRRRHREAAATSPSLLSENPDLQMRSLLDHPEMRRVMGLDVPALESVRIERRFDRRRLLQESAA